MVEQEHQKKTHRMITLKVRHLVIFLVVLLVAIFGLMQLTQFNKYTPVTLEENQNSREIVIEDVQENIDTQKKEDIRVVNSKNVIENVFPSVVKIVGEQKDDVRGSGLIIREDGYIITYYHVIGAEFQQTIRVMDYSEKIYVAKRVGWNTKNDIAVIKIEGEKFPALELANSDKVKVGDKVFVVGNPEGGAGDPTLSYSVTQGIVSQVNRLVSPEYPLMLQTDAPVNPGSSGSPLIDDKGNVIGIINLKLIGFATEGIGFAIPSNTIRPIVDEMIKKNPISTKRIVS